jgi:GTP-binding protein
MADDSPSTGDAKDPLVIRHLEFLGGMAAVGGWRPEAGLPEVAFAGRSNVGKSSLLNRLVRRKAFARVSQTPGKTREINFFEVNKQFVLVDLPGYGYARVSKGMRSEWAKLIDGYLRSAEQVRGIVQLVDARHPPTEQDLDMMEFLGEVGLPTIIALTKVDKLKKAEVPARVAAAAAALGVEESQIIPFSAVTGEGRDELAEALLSLLDQPSWRST